MGNVAQVDYIFVHQIGLNLRNLLSQKLVEAFENAYIEPPEEGALANILAMRYTKPLSKGVKQALSGVSLNLEQFDDGENDLPKLIGGFNDLISNKHDEGIEHVVKLYDEKLHLEHAKYAEEIFEIEMKLREAFSVIFIDTYENDFYNLLKDVNVQPMNQAKDTEMRPDLENEFFYLTFGQYRNLNEKKKVSNVDHLIKLLSQVSDFGTFHARLTQSPIQKEEYVDFITSLKAILDPIEDMRNCIAHNRAIPRKLRGDYSEARKKLIQLIDGFLATLPKGK